MELGNMAEILTDFFLKLGHKNNLDHFNFPLKHS